MTVLRYEAHAQQETRTQCSLHEVKNQKKKVQVRLVDEFTSFFKFKKSTAAKIVL